MAESDNVILFPIYRESLEKVERESYEALQKEQYETALDKLNFLLVHQYSSYDIHISKLISLIKLNQLTEAEDFCETLLTNRKDPYYYDYFEYYVMILYEKNKFVSILDAIEEERKQGIPHAYKRKLEDIYRLAYQMKAVQADELLNELNRAVEEENDQQQWNILNKWKEIKIEPPSLFNSLLKKETIHPAIKTFIIETLIDKQIDTEITLRKFGKATEFSITHLPKLCDHPIYLKTLKKISRLEQDNPTLFLQVNELLYQLCYIRYPDFYSEQEVDVVAEALIAIGAENLALPTKSVRKDREYKKHEKMIHICNKLYSNICID